MLYEAPAFGGETTMRARVIRELIDEIRRLRAIVEDSSTSHPRSRRLVVARDKPFGEGNTLQRVAAAAVDGGVLVGVRTGGGGRYGIGKVLVARSLVARVLRTELQGQEPAVAAVWIDADRDVLIRRWAERLGIGLAR